MKDAVREHERLSVCVNKTLAQIKLEIENNSYPVTEADLLILSDCPLCGSDKTLRISEVSLNKSLVFFSTDICQDCLHIYRAISPNEAWFVARWDQISTGTLSVYNESLEEKRRVRYELYYGLLHKHKRSGRLLDVGAAYGAGTRVFRERGFQVEALEPERDRAEYIRKICDIETHSCTLDKFKPNDETYDLIVFAHCLEHLNDPVGSLKTLKNWLKKDGVIYLEIPIAWKVIDWQDSLFMAHKHNFVEKNIRKLVAELGFNVLDSYLIPDNDAPFCNLALVIQPESDGLATIGSDRLLDPEQYDSQDLKCLYEIGLPVARPAGEVLKFDVPHITNFYHILKSDRRNCIVR